MWRNCPCESRYSRHLLRCGAQSEASSPGKYVIESILKSELDSDESTPTIYETALKVDVQAMPAKKFMQHIRALEDDGAGGHISISDSC